MPGLLDNEWVAGLLREQQGGANSRPMGLLGPAAWKPDPNEGLLTRFLGTNNPNDPRSEAMMQIGLGLMRRDLPGGLERANNTFRDYEDRGWKRAANELQLQRAGLDMRKGTLEVGELERKAAEDKQAAEVLRGFYGSNGAPQAPKPMFGGPTGAVNSALPPDLQIGALPAAPGYQAPPDGGVAPKAAIWQQYQTMGQRLAQAGLGKQAQAYFELAEKHRPKMAQTPQIVRDPATGKLVNVLIGDDGSTQVIPFGVKPDVAVQDLGGRVLAIDKNETPGGQSWAKTMTPGEVASNSLGWANNRVSRDRLAFDQSQPHYMEVNGQVVALPKTLGPGGAPVGRLATDASGAPLGGDSVKLTESQANAAQFAIRMRDSSRVIDQLEGKIWPSTVARAGYRPQFPSWMPGGQVVGAGVEVANRATVPADAERYYQAQENWVTANLRKESGAAIGKDEMARDIRKWFPQPGEGEASKEQKAAARRVAEEGMLLQAGPGAKLVPKALARADAATAERNKEAASKPVPLPSTKPQDLKHGTVYQLPNGKSGKWDSLQRKFEVQ